MTWRVVGVVLGTLFYAGLWVLVLAGATVLVGPLVTLPVLVVLVGAGNWFQQWLGIKRTAPQFARPATNEADDEPPSP